MSIPGFASAQAACDAAEPDNTDVCEGCSDNGCDKCDGDGYGCCDYCLHSDHDDYEEDPDDARDRAYAYDED